PPRRRSAPSRALRPASGRRARSAATSSARARRARRTGAWPRPTRRWRPRWPGATRWGAWVTRSTTSARSRRSSRATPAATSPATPSTPTAEGTSTACSGRLTWTDAGPVAPGRRTLGSCSNLDVQLDHGDAAGVPGPVLRDHPPEEVPGRGVLPRVPRQRLLGLVGGQESRPGGAAPEAADAHVAAGLGLEVPVPLGAVPEPARDEDAPGSGPADHLEHRVARLAGPAADVLEHQHPGAQQPAEPAAVQGH